MLGLATAQLAQVLVDDRRRVVASVTHHAVATNDAIADRRARERRDVALSLLLIKRGDQK